jgi:predicted HD phosphohydrolase
MTPGATGQPVKHRQNRLKMAEKWVSVMKPRELPFSGDSWNTFVMSPSAAVETAPTTPSATFTAMDHSTKEEWLAIGAETNRNQGRVADRVLMLLESLGDIVDGFVTDQLTHCLQTATLAERAGADEEVVVASLCHDIGKAISVPNHPAIAASIMKPYVRPEVHFMIEAHQDFQGRHYYGHFGMNPDARLKYEGHAAYELAERFADEWDQKAFDPNYDTLPLSHFEPMVRRVFAKPRFVTPS